MKKVIVTGANGFVGAALCKELSNQGIEIIAIVRPDTDDIKNIVELPGLHIVNCDLSDFKNLSYYIKDRNIDVLYHLAWTGCSGHLRGSENIQISNIQYTCDTIKACEDLKCKRFVFASSIMEYEVEALMSTEITPEITSLYSSAKIAADYMARAMAGKLGIDYVRAVISNIYGPGERNDRLINQSLRRLLKGEHCSFSAGDQLYDFIYITDAAKAFAAIGEKGRPNRTYYIGSKRPRPLKEFLYEMRDQVDPNILIGLGEKPFRGVSLTYKEFDIDAIKHDTGFIPLVDFNVGIRYTLEWLKETGND